MISTSKFIEGVRKNVARVNQYELGMDGTGGKCDCIGLIIGALRLMGETWTGTHGSNYAARNEMRTLRKLENAGQLTQGDIVYKSRAKGESNYALPSRYADSPDQLDYYHVGVVTRVSPLEITHCTGVDGGIKRDTSIGKWAHYGQLKRIKEEVLTMASYQVTGGRLNIRTGPGYEYDRTGQIDDGTIVSAAPVGDGTWLYVDNQGVNGYAMGKYLVRVADAPEPIAPVVDNVTVTLPRDMAEALLIALQKVLK